MSSNDLITIAGVFSNKSHADRARRSLREAGIAGDRITMLASLKGKSIDLREKTGSPALSSEQSRFYSEELYQGRAVLLIESERPGNDVIAILDAHEAVHVDIADFVHENRTHHTLPLYEEQLKVDKETRQVGEIVVRKIIEEVTAQAEVEALHEELDVEHVSVGQVVDERRGPWKEGDTLVVPVYEEQLTVVRQLVMREQLRIKLHTVKEKHILADTVRRENAVIEDPDQTGRVNVHQRGPEPSPNSEPMTPDQPDR